MAGTPTISLRIIEPAIRLLEQRGEDPAAFFAPIRGLSGVWQLRQSGRAGAEIADCRIPLSTAHQLWKHVEQNVNDPSFGLRAAERVEAGTFGMVSYIAHTAATLGEALLRVHRYFPLLCDLQMFQLSSRGEQIEVNFPSLGQASRQGREHDVAVLACYMRLTLGDDCRIDTASFSDPSPRNLDAYERIFVLKPRFAQATAGFTFSAKLLQAPLHTADPQLGSLLRGLAESLLTKFEQSITAVGQLQQLVLSVGADRSLSLRMAASNLGVSTRSLQRQLRMEGTTYRRIVESMRLEIAREILTNPRRTAGQAAATLGFCDSASFHRAFKRNAGMTPGEFKRTQHRALESS